MTLRDYTKATGILAKITELKSTLDRVEKKISVNAEGDNLDRYFNKQTLIDNIKSDLNGKISALETEFANI